MVEAGRVGCVPVIQLLHRNGSDRGRIPETMWLLARNANPNVADVENGWTAIHQAASRGHARTMRAVLDAGGDVGRRDQQGRTPIDLVRLMGRDKLVGLMPAAAATH
jgi:ankyrin repeat protein